MSPLTAPAVLEGRDLQSQSIVVYCVDDDPDYLELTQTGLERHDDFQVRTTQDQGEVLDHVDEIDCVVSDHDVPGTTGIELLEAIRERAPGLPFVLFTGQRRCEVVEPITETKWADFVAKESNAETMGLLASRVRNLVNRRIVAALASRGLVAVEAVDAGVALTRTDGTVQFANRPLGDLVGREPDALADEHWRTLFPAAEADRLEEAALPSVAEGWQWVGGVSLQRADGTTRATRTTISGVDDDSLVFTVREQNDPA